MRCAGCGCGARERITFEYVLLGGVTDQPEHAAGGGAAGAAERAAGEGEPDCVESRGRGLRTRCRRREAVEEFQRRLLGEGIAGVSAATARAGYLRGLRAVEEDGGGVARLGDSEWPGAGWLVQLRESAVKEVARLLSAGRDMGLAKGEQAPVTRLAAWRTTLSSLAKSPAMQRTPMALDAFDIGHDGGGVFGGVAGEGLGREWRGVHDGVVEDGRAGVLVDALDVLGCGEAEALIGLGHEVADEDAEAAGAGESCGDSLDEQVGDERRVEGAGSDGDEVGAFDGVEGLGQGGGIGRIDHEFSDTLFAGGDIGFAADEGAIFHARDEGGVGGGGGIDAAAGGENL